MEACPMRGIPLDELDKGDVVRVRMSCGSIRVGRFWGLRHHLGQWWVVVRVPKYGQIWLPTRLIVRIAKLRIRFRRRPR